MINILNIAIEAAHFNYLMKHRSSGIGSTPYPWQQGQFSTYLKTFFSPEMNHEEVEAYAARMSTNFFAYTGQRYQPKVRTPLDSEYIGGLRRRRVFAEPSLAEQAATAMFDSFIRATAVIDESTVTGDQP